MSREVTYKVEARGLEHWLGPREAQVMAAIWACSGPVAIRDVYEALGKERAYTTIMTTMQRLVAKGYLRISGGTSLAGGPGLIFTPVQSRAAFEEALVRLVIESLREDYPAAVQAALMTVPA